MTDLKTVDTAQHVTLYTTTWCPFCQKLTRQLDEKGISYQNVDVESDAEAAKWVESVNDGNRVVPTVKFSDGETMTNPPTSKVKNKLLELVG